MSRTVKCNANTTMVFNVFITDEPEGTVSKTCDALSHAEDIQCYGWRETDARSIDTGNPVYRVFFLCTRFLTAEDNQKYIERILRGE